MAMISKKLFSIPHLVFFTTIFLIMLSSRVNSLDSLSFSFGDEFQLDEHDLILQGDAHLKSILPFTGIELQLTKTDSEGAPQKNTIGRAIYTAPFRLWQKSTGKVSNFATHFGLELKKPSSKPGDGFAFFISPIKSTIPKNSKGGYLGLFNDKTAFNSSANPIVAVEFDTYFYDSWDPNYPHIGINVNSINSSAHVKWNREAEETLDVNINYDALGRNLSVTANGFDGVYAAVSYVVDLQTVLPEWVRVGITGASGDGVEMHNVYSWDFHSNLESIK